MAESISFSAVNATEEITFAATIDSEEIVFRYTDAARGPAGDGGGGGGVTSYVDDIESLPDYPTSFPTTPADINNVGTSKLLGRHGAGTGTAQEIGIDGGLELHGGNIRRAALTGFVEASAGSGTTTLSASAASEGGNGAADSGKLSKFSSTGSLTSTGFYSESAFDYAIYGSSTSSTGVNAESSSGVGLQAATDTGQYHAAFGFQGSEVSAIARTRGDYVWFYNGFIGQLETADITASRLWTLPDAQGTLALISQIPDISGKQDTITTLTSLSFYSLELGTALPITSGGTGGITAGAARSNLDAQQTLVSGTNIKTVASQSLLGSTNIPALLTDPTGITGAAALSNIVSLTQAQYDAIGSKSSTTLYIIT